MPLVTCGDRGLLGVPPYKMNETNIANYKCIKDKSLTF
jgi:hypothetical protein